MADEGEFCSVEFDQMLYRVISDLKFSIKEEQKAAIQHLYYGRDVLAILPTGFGKSLIFQVLVMLRTKCFQKQRQSSSNATILVISPLRSLIEDQLQEVADFGISAASLPEASLEDVKRGKYQIIYSSPECALEKEFLETLKEGDFHDNMVAVVIDESHTIETWTGRRKSSGKDKKVFREAFGELAKLRSFCREGTPLLALTGTADKDTVSCIQKDLNMKKAAIIFVSPERKNLIFTVNQVGNATEIFSKLEWLIEMLKETGVNCPKTLIFCNTLSDIAAVYNHIMLKLESSAYSPPVSRAPECCLIGMFHSNSYKDQKKRLLTQLKGKGVKRVVIASSALSMGVNFPDIRYVINWGPARNLLDQLQEAGRSGRDGKTSHSIIYFYGKQLIHCNRDVKNFVRCEGCLRVAAYSPFDASVKPLWPKHDCCSYCRKTCLCNNGKSCEVSFKFDTCRSQAPYPSQITRPVTTQDKEVLQDALHELVQNMNHEKLAVFDQAASHGFSEQLIDDIVKRCHCIFTISDITTNFPVFSRSHANSILEVINEIFDDIPEEYVQDRSHSAVTNCDNLEYLSLSDIGSDHIDNC